jgi:hypothetical protein
MPRSRKNHNGGYRVVKNKLHPDAKYSCSVGGGVTNPKHTTRGSLHQLLETYGKGNALAVAQSIQASIENGSDINMIKTLSRYGIGKQPSNGNGKTIADAHIWLEDKDGNIVDPTPPVMKGERHYKPFELKNQSRIWNEYKIRLMEMDKTARQNLTRTLYQQPASRMCGFNVYAYWRNHKDSYKIVVGALGFTQDDGTIFWEFG